MQAATARMSGKLTVEADPKDSIPKGLWNEDLRKIRNGLQKDSIRTESYAPSPDERRERTT